MSLGFNEFKAIYALSRIPVEMMNVHYQCTLFEFFVTSFINWCLLHTSNMRFAVIVFFAFMLPLVAAPNCGRGSMLFPLQTVFVGLPNPIYST